MNFRFLLLTLTIGILSSCSLITTPVKVVGKVTTTTIGITGKAVGAGFDALSSDDEQDSCEE